MMLNRLDELVGALEAWPIVQLFCGGEQRLEILKAFVEQRRAAGVSVVAFSGRHREKRLVERLQNEVGAVDVLIVDHWFGELVHPDEVGAFQRALSDFVFEKGGKLILASGGAADQKYSPLPEWVWERMGELMFEDVIEEDFLDPFAGLFPPLVQEGTLRGGEQAMVGATLVGAALVGAAGIVQQKVSSQLIVEAPVTSPVRRLYQMFVEIGSEEDLAINLEDDEDFKRMVGPVEARFCEWVYHQLEHRQLVDAIADSLLRASEIKRFSSRLKIAPEATKGMDAKAQLRHALAEMGIREPGLPPVVENGIRELRELAAALQRPADSVTDIEGRDISLDGHLVAARRGTERLLKLVATFLWDSGLNDIFCDVVEGNLQEFNNPGLVADSTSSKWLLNGDIGTLNYLLRAVDRERIARKRPLVFSRGQRDYWGDGVFWPVKELGVLFNTGMHDSGVSAEERRVRALKIVNAMLANVDGAGPRLRIPQPVQFFRRYFDDLGEHYEGWTMVQQAYGEAKLVKFYEVEGGFDLHVPYLFLAATNPSSIDVSCAKLGGWFLNPV